MQLKTLELNNILVKKSNRALMQQKNMENEYLITKKDKYNQGSLKQLNLVKITKFWLSFIINY